MYTYKTPPQIYSFILALHFEKGPHFLLALAVPMTQSFTCEDETKLALGNKRNLQTGAS